MCTLEQFKIDLKDQSADVARYEFSLDDSYFQAIDAPAISSGRLQTVLEVSKSGACYELRFHTDGCVRIPCDLCLDDYDQSVCTDNSLTVKLADSFSEEGDMLTIPESEGVVDVSWYIYEFIALSLPVRRVHEPGKCNPAMIDVLHEHDAARSSVEPTSDAIDPRWEKLKNLKLQD